MRANIILMGVLATFFFACAIVYTLWNIVAYDGEVEWAGSLGMALTGLMATFIGFYLVLVRRGQGGDIPADRLEAEIDDGDPEEGHFAPWSWWPIILAFALALAFLSLAGPTFLIPVGVAILLIALVGWVYEFYRGTAAR